MNKAEQSFILPPVFVYGLVIRSWLELTKPGERSSAPITLFTRGYCCFDISDREFWLTYQCLINLLCKSDCQLPLRQCYEKTQSVSPGKRHTMGCSNSTNKWNPLFINEYLSYGAIQLTDLFCRNISVIGVISEGSWSRLQTFQMIKIVLYHVHHMDIVFVYIL